MLFASLTGPEAPTASQNRVEPACIVSRSVVTDVKERLTLGALENASLTALGKSAVELGSESGVGDAGEVVVGLNVFLESLTASGETGQHRTQETRREWIATRLTCFQYDP